MSPVDWERLMNDVLDGVATREEQELLRDRLAQDPSLRARHRDLQELFDALGKVPLETPPPELRTGVARAISVGHRAHGPRRRGSGWLERPRAFLARRPGAGAAFAFATGAAVTAAVVLVFTQGPGAGLPASGTMAGAAGRLGAPIEARPIRVGAADFEIRSRRLADGMAMELSVRSQEPVQVDFEYDSRQLDAQELRWSPPAEIRASSGWVHLSAAASCRFLISFHGGGDPRSEIHVTLRAGDQSAKEVFRMAPDRGDP